MYRLQKMRAEVVLAETPTMFQDSGSMQRTSLRSGIRTRPRGSYIIRARTDFFWNVGQELFRALFFADQTTIDFDLFGRVCALPMNNNPFQFHDMAFSAPWAMMRRLANRDWGLLTPQPVRGPHLQLFAGPFLDENPLIDEIVNQVELYALRTSLETASKAGDDIPADLLRFYGLYMAILEKNFYIPGPDHEVIDIGAHVLGPAIWNSAVLRRLKSAARKKVAAEGPFETVLKAFHDFSGRGEMPPNYVVDPDEVASFLTRHCEPSRIARTPLPRVALPHTPESKGAADLPAPFGAIASRICSAISDPSGHPILLARALLDQARAELDATPSDAQMRDIFKLLLASARNWYIEGLAEAWQFADTYPLHADIAELVAMTEYLNRQGRGVYPTSCVFLAREIARKGIEQTPEDITRALFLLKEIHRVAAAQLPQSVAAHVSELEESFRPRCSRCGGANFGPGPNGRSSANGAMPKCLDCQSLEYHRIFCSLLRQACHACPGAVEALYVDSRFVSWTRLRSADAFPLVMERIVPAFDWTGALGSATFIFLAGDTDLLARLDALDQFGQETIIYALPPAFDALAATVSRPDAIEALTLRDVGTNATSRARRALASQKAPA